MTSIDTMAQLLIQLFVKHKCILEETVLKLIKGHVEINDVVNKMNEYLDVLGFYLHRELINGKEYFVLNCEQIFDGNKSEKGKEKSDGKKKRKRGMIRGIDNTEIEEIDAIDEDKEDENEESDGVDVRGDEGGDRHISTVKKDYKNGIEKNEKDVGNENNTAQKIDSENEIDMINDSRNDIENTTKYTHPVDPNDELNEKNSFSDKEILINEEILFNCKFTKVELCLYYLIVYYIIKNQQFLKRRQSEYTNINTNTTDTTTTYESLCFELNIKNGDTQNNICM